jgi:hypothetical protein
LNSSVSSGTSVKSHTEDRGIGLRVDGNDDLAAPHAREVLHGPVDAAGDVEAGVDHLARQPDLAAGRLVAGVHGGPRGPDGGVERFGKVEEDLEVLLALERSTARHDDVGVSDVLGAAARADEFDGPCPLVLVGQVRWQGRDVRVSGRGRFGGRVDVGPDGEDLEPVIGQGELPDALGTVHRALDVQCPVDPLHLDAVGGQRRLEPRRHPRRQVAGQGSRRHEHQVRAVLLDRGAHGPGIGHGAVQAQLGVVDHVHQLGAVPGRDVGRGLAVLADDDGVDCAAA